MRSNPLILRALAATACVGHFHTLAMMRRSIAPPHVVTKGPVGVATTVAAYKDTFEWTGEIATDVEQIEIFPVAALAGVNL